jgi:hypothetical protein
MESMVTMTMTTVSIATKSLSSSHCYLPVCCSAIGESTIDSREQPLAKTGHSVGFGACLQPR